MNTEDPVGLCDDGTQGHVWLKCNPGCAICGDHSGFMCDVCCEVVDHVYQPLAYNEIQDKVRDKSGTLPGESG